MHCACLWADYLHERQCAAEGDGEGEGGRLGGPSGDGERLAGSGIGALMGAQEEGAAVGALEAEDILLGGVQFGLRAGCGFECVGVDGHGGLPLFGLFYRGEAVEGYFRPGHVVGAVCEAELWAVGEEVGVVGRHIIEVGDVECHGCRGVLISSNSTL